MTCAKQFWKKMYTGWVMSIERQGNQGSTSPDTMCVVPYIAFCVCACYFTKTRSNLLWFWWLQNLAVHTNTYMLHDQLFLILSTPFCHNAISLPVLKFIFKLVFKGTFKKNGYSPNDNDNSSLYLNWLSSDNFGGFSHLMYVSLMAEGMVGEETTSVSRANELLKALRIWMSWRDTDGERTRWNAMKRKRRK